MKKYIINEDKLISLFAASYKLQALESGGVDNWSWYSDACNDWLNEVRPADLDEDEAWDYGFVNLAEDIIQSKFEEYKNEV